MNSNNLANTQVQDAPATSATDADAIATLKGMLKAKADHDRQAMLKSRKEDDGKDNEEEGDEEEEYDEEYMKKYMKKFLKKNNKFVQSLMGLQKAVDTAYENAAQHDDLTAEVTMIDGTEMFKAFQGATDAFVKALVTVCDRLDALEEQVSSQNDITMASGEVLVKAVETLEALASTPAPVKSQLVGKGAPMQKAVSAQSAGDNASAAPEIGITDAKRILVKAAAAGDGVAGKVLTQVESCFGNMGLLPASSLKYIADLAASNK